METVNKAVETEVAKVAAVVLKDTSNVVISSAANDAQVAQANSASALTALWQERKAWEANAYRTSNQQLYAILAKCYAFYLKTSGTGDAGKQYREDLRAFIAQHKLGFNKNSHGIVKVIKCVFYDGEKSLDRRRLSTYSLVLRSAYADKIAADDLAAHIEKCGGVQEMRLAKCNAKPLVKRAELGREAVDRAAVLTTVHCDAISQQIDSTDFDVPFVAILVARVTGEVEIRSVLKSKGAVNAALAAHYSAANDSTKQTKAA